MIVKQVEKTSTDAHGCCGGPAVSASACCVKDEQAKASGEAGCGCSTTTEVRGTAESSCCQTG